MTSRIRSLLLPPFLVLSLTLSLTAQSSQADSLPLGSPVALSAAVASDKPHDLPARRQPIATDSATLAQYVGVFELSPGQYRVVSRRGDSLFSQQTDSAEQALIAEARDTFHYSHDSATTLTFLRDSTGAIVSHRLRQAGLDSDAKRFTGPQADSIAQSIAVTRVDPAVLLTYVGEYELMPGFTLTVTVKDGHIFAQGTGQPQVEMFPRTSETFIVRQVGAEVTFVKGPGGKSNGLVLKQYGQTIPAQRLR